MAKRTFTIILDDDTQIKSLELNGNSFISKTELKAADIEGKLSKVTVKGSDGSVEEHGQMTLVQITQDGGKWWLCLRDLTDAEIQAATLKSQLTDANNAIADNTNALVDLGDVTEGNNSDSESAMAELADMVASIDERITALESK